MKKIVLLISLLFLSLFWMGWGEKVFKDFAEERSDKSDENLAKRMDAVSSSTSTNGVGLERETDSPATAKENSGRQLASSSFSKRLFPHGRLVSSVEIAGEKPGEVRLIQILETQMKQPFVRVEERFVRNGSQRQLLEELAMVSNQVLLQRPESLPESDFIALMKKAGASQVKAIGGSFLVTFTARPEDPLALDSFMQKVRELAPVSDLMIEPNYIRKII